MESSYYLIPPNTDRNSNDQDNLTLNLNENATNAINQATVNTNANTSTIANLKKNLWKEEEEFRNKSSINHLEPIHIFLKLKPFSKEEQALNKEHKCFFVNSDTSIIINPPKTSIYLKSLASKQQGQSTNRLFKFSYVFQPNITQKDFFNATTYPCLSKFFEGDNLLIFSYGVTNSGKTYTMQGDSKNPGLIPRTLDLLFNVINENLDQKKAYKYKPDKFNEAFLLSDNELQQSLNYKEQLLKMCVNVKEFDQTINDIQQFNAGADMSCLVEASKNCFSTESLASIGVNFHIKDTETQIGDLKVPNDTKYAIWISFYELYNDMIYDLLVPIGRKDEKRNPLKIREDSSRIPYVEGLIQVPVFNTYEAIKVLKYGEKSLQKASNSINLNSSRSHAIFCLKIVKIVNEATLSVNQLSFCDLAGIERSSKTNPGKLQLKEASTINSSLLALSRCINTLMYNQKNKNNSMQVPYRINKLTRLFQAYFEGHGMIKMIVNINPSISCFDETVGVLKFSSIANQIQINLNEDEKMLYKLEFEENNKSVAWEMDESELSDVDEGDEEGDEEDEEDEDEEEEEEEEEEQNDDDDEEDEDEDEDEDETMEEEKSIKKSKKATSAKKIAKTVESINETVETTSTTAKSHDEDDDDDDEEEDGEESDEDEDEDDEDTKLLYDSDDENFDKYTKQKLIELVKKLKNDLEKATEAAFPYKIKEEFIASYCKRLTDNATFYENQIKEQRAIVERKYLNKIECLRKLHKIEIDEKLSEQEAKLKDEIEEANKAKEEIEQKLKEKTQYLTSTNEKLAKFDKQAQNEMCELKAKVEEANKTNTQLNETVKQLQQEKQQLKLELKLTNQQYEKAKAELKETNEAHKNYKVELDGKINEIKMLKESLTEKTSQIKKLENEISEINANSMQQIAQHKLECKQAFAKCEQVKAEFQGLNETISKLKANEMSYVNEISHLKLDLTQLETKIHKYEKLIEEIKENQFMAVNDKENHVNGGVSSISASIGVASSHAIETENGHGKRVATKTKHSKATKTSKTSVISDEIIEENDHEECVVEEKKLKTIENTLTVNNLHVTASSIVEDSMVVVNDYESKHATIAAAPTVVQKKNKLTNRLTDLLTKSPIFDSVRNSRQLRNAKSKAATISNAEDKELIASVIAAESKKTRTVKGSVSKKTSLLESFDKLKSADDVIEVNDHVESIVEAEGATKAKKKRGKK